MAQSIRSSSNRIKVIHYFPTKAYGQEGDTVVSKISGKGVFLCVKAGGLWYAQTTMQPLQKINTAYIKNLSSDKMTIKRLQNAGVNTDKFIVSDNGDIKYRTADDILNDLGLGSLNSFDIAYKTAYCSLGQYSDKDTCEANGGTWYYSENDSHDSISSTAENQLLTVSQSIGNVDAESTLTYDGSTLEIKRNTNYDDNWQTSAQTDLLKLSYDSSDYAKFTVGSNGDLVISTTDAAGFNANLLLDADGDITLDAYSKQIYFAFNGTTMAQIDLNASAFKLMHSSDQGDYFNIDVGVAGVTTISTVDADASAAHLTLQPDGHLVLDPVSKKTIINTSDGLYFDGGSDTYIHEVSADKLAFVVGGITMLELHESISDGVFVQNSDLVLDAAKKIIFDGIITGHTSIAQTTADVMTFAVGGDIMFVLDEANDKITLNATNHVLGLADGTEFSVANSSFAGMILGYRMIGEDAAHDAYTLTTSMVVPDAAMTVRFIAPPSGSVEVMVQVFFDGASNRVCNFGLSDNATYNSLGDSYEQATGQVDESDTHVHQHYWTITGLTAGSTYNYWFGASANGGTLNWGGTGAGRYCDFIMKVTALPTAVSDFAEYD